MWAAGVVLAELFGGTETWRALKDYFKTRRGDVKSEDELHKLASKIVTVMKLDAESGVGNTCSLLTNAGTGHAHGNSDGVRYVQLQVTNILRCCFARETSVPTSSGVARISSSDCERLLVKLWNTLYPSQPWGTFCAALSAPLESPFAKAYNNIERRGMYYRLVICRLLRSLLHRCAVIIKKGEKLQMDPSTRRLLQDRLQDHEHRLRKKLFETLERAIQCFRLALAQAKIPKCVQCGRASHLITHEADGTRTTMPLHSCANCDVVWYCGPECEVSFRSSLAGREHYFDGGCQFALSWRRSKLSSAGVTQLTEFVLMQGEMWEIAGSSVGSKHDLNEVLAQFVTVQRVWERMYFNESNVSSDKNVIHGRIMGITRDTTSQMDAESPMTQACKRALGGSA